MDSTYCFFLFKIASKSSFRNWQETPCTNVRIVLYINRHLAEAVLSPYLHRDSKSTTKKDIDTWMVKSCLIEAIYASSFRQIKLVVCSTKWRKAISSLSYVVCALKLMMSWFDPVFLHPVKFLKSAIQSISSSDNWIEVLIDYRCKGR